MFKFTRFARHFAFIAVALACASSAQALLFRAYLASDGNDASPCTLQAPCRLLPRALNAVASGGEIWMLDSANYNNGTVIINKSVSILAVPGAVGSVVAVNAGAAIYISANLLKVSLRNLAIGPQAGAAPGSHGVVLSGNSSVTIENSLIAGVPETGVLASDGNVTIIDTTIRNNGRWAIAAQSGAQISVARAAMLNNGDGGAFALGNEADFSNIDISDSLIANGTIAGNGVRAYCDHSAARATISVTRCTIRGFDSPLNADTGGNCRSDLIVSSSMFLDNKYEWYQANDGKIFTLSNNHFAPYGHIGEVGVLTPLSPK